MTGIVITPSTLLCPTSSEDKAVSLSYLAAYMAVLVATGADAETVRAVSILPRIPMSLNTSSIVSGINISLMKETKYTSFFKNKFLKLQFAKNVPNKIIANGELQAAMRVIVSLTKNGSLG